MVRRWGNSKLEANIKNVVCYYCGNPIKDKSWFKIRRMNGHAFAFCSKLCDKIWSKKTSVR